MFNLSVEKTRQLIKVCNYYYIDGMNQNQIAQKMGISRSQISRMLTQAKASGIVNISIKNPFSEEQKYERWLTQTFGILDAVVVDTPDHEISETSRRLASAATTLLDAALKDNTTLGIMAGLTMNGISEEIGYIDRKNITIVPLVGGCGNEGKWQANLNACNLGEKLHAPYSQLNTPVIVGSAEIRDALIQEPNIADVLELGRNASTVLVGIGQFSADATIVKSGFLSPVDIAELAEKGAVASLCNSFLNKNGECIDFSGYSRMIGLTAPDLKRIPKVIAIANGQNKVQAIAATLRGRWIDILVTSLNTARSIREYCMR